MLIETTFTQVAQSLLWPVLALVALAFAYALWSAGATLMEAWQRWRSPAFAVLRPRPATPWRSWSCRCCAASSRCGC
ncbi:MAG: hypothetical protein PGN26_10925 [Xylophilus ampelinus]